MTQLDLVRSNSFWAEATNQRPAPLPPLLRSRPTGEARVYTRTHTQTHTPVAQAWHTRRHCIFMRAWAWVGPGVCGIACLFCLPCTRAGARSSSANPARANNGTPDHGSATAARDVPREDAGAARRSPRSARRWQRPVCPATGAAATASRAGGSLLARKGAAAAAAQAIRAAGWLDQAIHARRLRVLHPRRHKSHAMGGASRCVNGRVARAGSAAEEAAASSGEEKLACTSAAFWSPLL